MNARSASAVLLLLALAALTPFSPLSPLAAHAAAPSSASNAPVSDSPDAPDAPAEPTTPDPVGYASGNVYEAATDVRVLCPDVDLAFRRAYCSGSQSVGDLGRGWTHSYEVGVSALADGRVVVRVAAEEGASDACRTFPAVAAGASATNAAGCVLSRGADGLLHRDSSTDPTAPTGRVHMSQFARKFDIIHVMQ